MLLVIDVGNSHMVLGVYRGNTLAHHFRLSTNRRRTEDEYGVLLRELLHDCGLTTADINAVVLASVVPPLNRVLERMCLARFGSPPLVVGPGIKTGMPILCDSPREVGADRIVNSVAAYERFAATEGGPYGAIVVDFGTATTFDVVSPRGEYLGGAIAPGVMIATEALFLNASKLPRVDLEIPRSAIGKNTVTSMQAGIMYGSIAMVDGMIARMCNELDFEPKTIATGGIASLIRSEAIEAVDDFLTLEGLRLIHGRNQ